MQTKSILAAALLSTATLVASQNTVISPDQSSKVIADELNYLSSVYQGAAFSSVVNELATGVPSSVLNAMISVGNDPSGPAYSSVISLLPADAQSFYLGVQSQASAIVASDLSVASTGTASPGSTMSTASMTSGTTSASGATTSASTASSTSATSTSGASAAATVTHNAATQPTAAVMVAGAAAAGILGLVVLL